MRWALVAAGLLLVGALAGCAAQLAGAATHVDDGVFFDDFDEPDLAAFAARGWQVRTQRGHPGVEGASWGSEGVALVDDNARAGNRLLRLRIRTDGSAANTVQAQVCQQRKFFEGTYAARLRFNDMPIAGRDGDVVVQTFYTVAPLRFDFDPQYSEFDWEYLPNGGWGDARTRLYGVSWQTVRLEPWLTFNQPHQEFRSMGGWHVLLMQIAHGRTLLYIDGELRAEHGGRNYPVVPMSLNFSQWFAPGGALANESGTRVYEQDVDWVYHARNRVLAPREVDAEVARLRAGGRGYVDGVPATDPPLDSRCDF